MLTAGIDIGSLTSKCLILEENKTAGQVVLPTGRGGEATANKVFQMALDDAGVSSSDIEYIIATGYGRISISFQNKTISEITCHGKGVYSLFPQARIIIDIGGQDSKVIRLNDSGNIDDFAMNDKCAAGSGRFLEVMAQALEVDLPQMGNLALLAENTIDISNTCTVFAESEVISLVSRKIPINDILAGICNAIAERVYGLAIRKLRGKTTEGMVVMSGGVAKNAGVLRFLEQKFGHRIIVPEEPQLVGALGAALIGQKNLRSQQQ
ncbi:acyl-CoA dehydratase activase [Thermodesulfobacteriota bacterium]